MSISPVENYLEAIKFGTPKYMPRANEEIIHSFELRRGKAFTSWTDSWGIDWVVDMEETVPFPKGNPLPDITKLNEYELPNPDCLFDGLGDEIEMMKKAKEEGKLIIGFYSQLLYERVWAIMGLENFMIALIEEPELTRELLHKIAGYVKRVFENFLELGVDGVTFSEDLGTQRALMFSAAHLDEFFMPEYRFMFEDLLKENKIVNFHCCGCIEEVVDRIADLKATILNPIQSSANDISKIKEITFGKTALQGGISSHLLVVGTQQEVKDETARVIELLKPGGGYICGPDQILPEFPKENLDAMYKTALELGKY